VMRSKFFIAPKGHYRSRFYSATMVLTDSVDSQKLWSGPAGGSCKL
jgi:hypothetical protein